MENDENIGIYKCKYSGKQALYHRFARFLNFMITSFWWKLWELQWDEVLEDDSLCLDGNHYNLLRIMCRVYSSLGKSENRCRLSNQEWDTRWCTPCLGIGIYFSTFQLTKNEELVSLVEIWIERQACNIDCSMRISFCSFMFSLCLSLIYYINFWLCTHL